MTSPNAQPDISADDTPRRETSTPGVVNDGWDLHVEWVGCRLDSAPAILGTFTFAERSFQAFNSFTRSQMELMNELVPDMLQAQRYRNDVTLRRFWAFVYRQFDDIYPARDWTEWTTEEDLRVAGMERRVVSTLNTVYARILPDDMFVSQAIHFYMLMEGMNRQGLIRTGRDRFVE